MSQRLDEFVADLDSIDDRELRAEYLLETGSRFSPVPESVAKRPYPPEAKVPACESEVFAFATKNSDETYKLYFAVENPQGVSAKSLAVILDESLSGKTRDEILAVSESLVTRIFGTGISMGKGEGLMGMIRMAKALVKGKE